MYRRLTSDALTPVAAWDRISRGKNSFLFESVVGGERIGRYSILGADPWKRIEARGRQVTISTAQGIERKAEVDDPLAELQAMLTELEAVHLPGLPRFCGGAVGYAGYDVVRYSEQLDSPPPDDRGLPDLSFAIYDQVVIFDHISKTILVVAHSSPDASDPEVAWQDACSRVDDLCALLQQSEAGLQTVDISLDAAPPETPASDFSRESFEAAVEKCREYIRAGDIFQVVLSQRLQKETTAAPLDIYRALRVVNPSPYMFLIRTPEMHLIGSSPEIMVRVDEGLTTVRPLAGTRPRGATPEEDLALEKELLADEKERAEHVMLIDLARNDVGRVAQYGSVQLKDEMIVERYSHVMHITSSVTGQLREGLSAFDALRAALPAGTVSGAPKVRAMEIIDELEPHRRGPYAGAVGYIDFSGNMDTCIALRTLVMQGQTVYIQAGAGIVADSVPAKEYDETLNKARAMLKSIEIAERQL